MDVRYCGPLVDEAVILRLCQQATARQPGAIRGCRTDADAGVTRLAVSSFVVAETVAAALTRMGLAAVALREVPGVLVRGWEAAALRRRLAIALAGVDDLSVEWAATADIALHYFEQLTDPADLGGPGIQDVEAREVSVLVEETILRSQPLPHRAPSLSDVTSLLKLIRAAETRYSELIGQHVDLAEYAVEHYRDRLLTGQNPAGARAAVIAHITATTTTPESRA